MTNCKNCGAVINPKENKCSYCGTSYLNEDTEADKINEFLQSYVEYMKTNDCRDKEFAIKIIQKIRERGKAK